MMRTEMKTTSLLLMSMIALAIPSNAQDMPSSEKLRETVAAIQDLISEEDYSGAVTKLFSLTDTNEIVRATQHLQRPRCLTMYEQLFDIIFRPEPFKNFKPVNTPCINQFSILTPDFTDIALFNDHIDITVLISLFILP